MQMIKITRSSNPPDGYFAVPICPKQTSEEHEAYKVTISRLIAIPDRPKLIEDYWGNTATAVEGLIIDSQFFAPIFRWFLSDTMSNIGEGQLSFGPNDAFMIKSPASLRRKVVLMTNEASKISEFSREIVEKKVVQSLNDTLRGSIIVDSAAAIRKTLQVLEQQANLLGWPLYVNNLWNKPSTGYIGIHTQIKMTWRDKSIISEVQVHFSQIFDGTMQCPKEVSHKFYERTRELETTAFPQEEMRFFDAITESVTKNIFVGSMGMIAKQKTQSKL